MAEHKGVYDVVIIGSGPGGYVAGIRAGQLGLRAAVVERADLGGVCLNWGCIPTKALLKNAEVVGYFQDAATWGVSFDNLKFDFSAAVKRSRQVVKRLTTGVGALLRKNKVDVIKGEAMLVAPDTIQVKGETDQTIRTRHIVIATGSRARSLPGLTIDGQRVISNRHAVVLESVPKSIIIMGAGAVGVEFATIFHAYECDVTVVEMLPNVLPLEDEEVSATLAKSLTKQGINLMTNTRVEGVDLDGEGVRVRVSADGQADTLTGDKVLVAIGRAPNSEQIGLEQVGINSERGFIQVDEMLRTNVQGIYAIGDVVGAPLLAHKAMHEGIIAIEHIAGQNPHPINHSNIPACTYCHPEVASVGLTEKAARDQGYELEIGKFPFQASGRALGAADYEGFVKLLVDKKYGEILGAHIIGTGATEIIHEIALARTAELTPNEIIATIHAHPTLAEAVGEAALGSLGRMIHF
ncbi:MAG: dihydrolipoyl dehydrogenase [Chloroflexi bacterium RBG_16_57_9]|nr:MAG: dihydrolipoyl dehydrogenase [Chloroflexi bacterium RBG_16_57_9]